MAQEFPQVQPNGSLMIAWQVKNKPVLVVGGGEVRFVRIRLTHLPSSLKQQYINIITNSAKTQGRRLPHPARPKRLRSCHNNKPICRPLRRSSPPDQPEPNQPHRPCLPRLGPGHAGPVTSPRGRRRSRRVNADLAAVQAEADSREHRGRAERVRLLLWKRAPRWPAAGHGQHEREWSADGAYCAEENCGESAGRDGRGDWERRGVEGDVEGEGARGGGGGEEDEVVSICCFLRWFGLADGC